ncbi:apolipoprotein N-acyltransferase [soil metagenome]
MNRTLQIWALQTNPAYLAPSQNCRQLGVQLHNKLQDAEAPDLVVLPELFATGYFFNSREDLAKVAEPLGEGRVFDWLRTMAADLGTAFVAGYPERSGKQYYNSAVIVHPDGAITNYRKTHLYYKEKLYFTPGDSGFVVTDIQTREGLSYRLGVMVCFDWYFPESARTLALEGADVIAHPSNLVRPNCPQAMPIRALENHVFTVTANRIGAETAHNETLRFIGQSLICSPTGQVLASAPADEPAMINAAINPHESRDRQLTAHNHLFGDRRTEHYAFS